MSAIRVGEPKLRLANCLRFFSGGQVRILNGARFSCLNECNPRTRGVIVSSVFDFNPPTMVVYHSVRPSGTVLRDTGLRGISVFDAPRDASSLATSLMRCLGGRLTPEVAHRNILIRICNRNYLLANSDNINGDRATVRLVGHNRHLITSSTMRVEEATRAALCNRSPRGVHRFVRLQNVKVVGTEGLFNVNTVGLRRGVSVMVGLRR